VRTRLTLWYVAILSGVLALYAGSSLLFLHVSLRRELDRNLRAEFERVEDLLTAAPDGSLRMGGHGGEGELQGVVELLLVQPVAPDETPRGTPLLAVDSVGAGVHEKVLIVLEGRAAGEALGRKAAPVDAAIIGIVDRVDVQE